MIRALLLILVLPLLLPGCCPCDATLRKHVIEGNYRQIAFLHSGTWVDLKNGKRCRLLATERSEVWAWIEECGPECTERPVVIE